MKVGYIALFFTYANSKGATDSKKQNKQTNKKDKNKRESKRRKKRKAFQAKSSWEQDNLSIGIEQQPRKSRISLRHMIHPFKLDLPNQGSFSPVPINSSPPSNQPAESPSSATADGS